MVLVATGAGLIVLALIADVIGLGGGEGFGYQQLIVLIVGLVLVVSGLNILVGARLRQRLEHPPRDDRA